MDKPYRQTYRAWHKLLTKIPPEYHQQDLEESVKAIFSAFALTVCIMLAICALIIAWEGQAHAYTPEQAVLAIIGEAEGEPQQGKEAVACAINNRGTLHGVYGLHAPRVRHHLYSKETRDNAIVAYEIAEDSEYCDNLIHGAQYWASLTLDQKWIHRMENHHYIPIATIGNTIFFRKD